MTRVRVLGIEVPRARLDLWATWFAPAVQPFGVPTELARRVPGLPGHALTPELRDTVGLYAGVADAPDEVVWLDEAAFAALPREDRTALVRSRQGRDLASRTLCPSVRTWTPRLDEHRARRVREQADGHRFTWWPGLLAGLEEDVLAAFVANDRRPDRSAEVLEQTWREAEELLPGARTLAGTFAGGSGPNCFGTVMAAAGVPGAAEDWVEQEPFEDWLAAAATPVRGTADDRPGTVLVWRDTDGLAQHAAVTLGGGWALHKASQGWTSPRQVLTVRDCLAASRLPGVHLRRHRIVAAGRA